MTLPAKLRDLMTSARERAENEGRVDQNGSVHFSVERKEFMDWRIDTAKEHGEDISKWPPEVQKEFSERYVSRQCD